MHFKFKVFIEVNFLNLFQWWLFLKLLDITRDSR